MASPPSVAILIRLLPLFFLCFLFPSVSHAKPSYSSQHMKHSQHNPSIHSPSLLSPANATWNNTIDHIPPNSNNTSLSFKPSLVSHQQTLSHNPRNHFPHHDENNSSSVEPQSSPNSLRNHHQITRIAKLLQHTHQLHQNILKQRHQNERATVQFQRSLRRLSSLSAQRATAQNALQAINRQLKEYHRQIPLYDRTLRILNKQAGAAILEINRLRTSKYSIMHEKALLQDHFRHRGLGAWVQKYIKGAVNPLVAGAVVEGTANVVEPMLDGIEKLADMNEDISKLMADQLSYSVPVVEKPFYSGFVTYAVLLLPLVLVTSILLKIKRGLRKFSIGHIIILGNFYFTLLSGGCFIATLLGKVDVLLTFRHSNMGMFDLVMVLHGILYMAHVAIHISMVLRSRDKSLALHTVFLGMIGSHFFLHSYLHAMHNEDPHVDTKAYAVYTGVFAYILYTWTVKHIRMSMEKKSLTLNNTSIVSSNRQDSAPTGSTYSKPRLESCLRNEMSIDSVFQLGPTISTEYGAFAGTTHVSGLGTISSTAKADDPKDL